MTQTTHSLKQEYVDYIKTVCEEFGNNAHELINVLHRVQEKFGYLPPEVQDAIASCLNISVAKVYGVVTFYSFFTMTPKGKHPISICTGTACFVRGAESIVEEFQRQLGIRVGDTTADGVFSLTCLRCVGACGLAPVVMVGEKIFGHVAVEDVGRIIEEYKELGSV